tara:strand:- start:913 stop:1695 length:783 start_codon:yes stop_codon:yes gene_type:complete
MNFFFSFPHTNIDIKSDVRCELMIPKFNNNGKTFNKVSLWTAFIQNNNWEYEKCNVFNDDNFYYVEPEDNNKFIYFLAKEEDVNTSNNNKKYELLNFKNIINTYPQYRANLKIFLKNRGFSSYQSDYPHEMTKIESNILCPLDILLDKDADQNFLFLPNIFFLPKIDKRYCYIIDLEEKNKIESFEIYTNAGNLIQIKNELVKPNLYFYTHKISGIPIFISIKNGCISMEHTHSSQHFIISNDRNEVVRNLKLRLDEIIT